MSKQDNLLLDCSFSVVLKPSCASIFFWMRLSWQLLENLAETTENQPKLANRRFSNKEQHLSFFWRLSIFFRFFQCSFVFGSVRHRDPRHCGSREARVRAQAHAFHFQKRSAPQFRKFSSKIAHFQWRSASQFKKRENGNWTEPTFSRKGEIFIWCPIKKNNMWQFLLFYFRQISVKWKLVDKKIHFSIWCRAPSKVRFTAKHLTLLGLFGVHLSIRRARKKKTKLISFLFNKCFANVCAKYFCVFSEEEKGENMKYLFFNLRQISVNWKRSENVSIFKCFNCFPSF